MDNLIYAMYQITALEQFVEKKEPRGFTVWTEKILSQNQKILMKRARGNNGEDGVAIDNPTSVREFLSDISGKKRAEYEVEKEEATEARMSSGYRGNKSSNESNGTKKRGNPRDEDDDDDGPPPKKSSVAKGTSKKARSRRANDDSDSEMEYQARPSRTTTKKPNYNYDDSGAEEIDDSEDEEMPKSTARGKKAASSTLKRNGKSSRATLQLESDSDDEPSSRFGRGGGAWGSASQSTNGRGRR